MIYILIYELFMIGNRCKQSIIYMYRTNYSPNYFLISIIPYFPQITTYFILGNYPS